MFHFSVFISFFSYFSTAQAGKNGPARNIILQAVDIPPIYTQRFPR